MSTPSSPAAVRRRPCVLRGDGGGQQQQRATTTTTRSSSVDRLLADIAYQWESERRRRLADGRPFRGRHGDERPGSMTTSMTETTSRYDDDEDVDAEAASAYWWTDVFLRYFVFDEDDDEDRTKSTVAADSDDLLFFVRRRRRRHNDKSERRLPPARQIAYETRAYRKQQHRRHQQHPALLPIGDPAVLWRHTVCLNAIVHRLRYTLTVAVCAYVPRKTAAECYDRVADYSYPDDREEYDLQLLSRHVHTVYASTTGRRMDAAKGPRERPVYPAVCWAVDDYAEAFRTVIVQPGQMVCAELVATWPGQSVVEESRDEDDGHSEDEDNDDGGTSCRRSAVRVRQKQNRAVLFSAAVPYTAVRATYECKMSLYRKAERQRRKQHKRGGGKKSSLGAALSASLTALFTGAKDSKSSLDGGDFDCYDGTASSSADRVEYVTVHGCVAGCDPRWLSDEDADFDWDDIANSDGTKGLAQMAVALAPVQPTETLTPSCEYGGLFGSLLEQYYVVESDGEYGGDDDCRLQQRQYSAAVESPYAASEPGDYYDYGWDYETAASSGHQTPQTPSTHHYQKRQFDRQRRRRHRRLSDPCSTSVYDLLYGQPNAQHGEQLECSRRRRQQQQQHGDGHRQQQLGGYAFGPRSSAAATPERPAADRPHRAWSESEGLDRCGFSGADLTRPAKQRPMLLPPPPVPYYCAAEAAASGYMRYLHKSPSGWWSRERSRRAAERGRRSERRRRSETSSTSAANRRRSVSAGGNGCGGDDTDDDRGGDSDSDGGRSSSDEADSDGEFVGALAAAAAVGHDPDREWEQRGATGDPVADWEHGGCDDAVEWTASIVATDLRHAWPARNGLDVDYQPRMIPTSGNYLLTESVAPSRTTSTLFDDSIWCGSGPSPLPLGPVVASQQPLSLQQQYISISQPQPQRHRRPPPPQFRPQPLEPPPPPPTLSVAFTAVACPWWTVLEDVLLVTTATTNSGGRTNDSAPEFPLLTFD